MPSLRTLQALSLSLALLGLNSVSSAAPAPSALDTALARLVTEGKVPAAALLADEGANSRFTHAEALANAGTPRTVPGTGPRTTNGIAEGVEDGGTNGAAGNTPADSPASASPRRTGRPVSGSPTATSLHRSDHFRAGSITKTFIATVVLQLAAEHRLSLSDSVDAHLPGLVRGAGNDGRVLTLRALLTHTSGLADFTADTAGAVPLTPAQAVRIALTHPSADRGRFAYSNTNYVLLGMVVEQVTGRSYAAEAERRLITPLRLTGTSFPGSRHALPEPHGRAYSADGTDVTDLDPRVAGAAGELVTTLADLNRFYAALLRGDLLPPRQLREMLDTRTAHGSYGMGLYSVKLPCGATVWGHNGRITGSYVRTAATSDGRHVLTFRVNTDAIADPSVEPALLAAEFCPRTPWNERVPSRDPRSGHSFG
ncbi:beta-lactamase family protein [Streptomyces sp. BV286]|uniref:serine hydrolase domain-containing protein n=1 Tax=Streptomyces sp. BV286 TaxID=2849672 RepID=UPI001C2EA8E6|nr:serine hydrolase domain-containing protein [Streptomyces sp. BV286]MBV1940474.1 beta-lactamase family protein [Streptomyces sp. BV286]